MLNYCMWSDWFAPLAPAWMEPGGKPPVPEAWSRQPFLKQLLTKCPGVGERESLSPADPGTSRRGHFICRYCGREEKLEIRGKKTFSQHLPVPHETT